MLLKTHRLMNADPGATGGGAPPAPAPAPAAPPAEPPATPPAPAPAPGEPPAAPPTEPPAPPADPKSALAAGATADEWSAAKVPEKFQVKNDKGELDVTATFRKVEEHRANLEKRLGAGENIRPKTADDYKLPDTEEFKAIGIDDATAKGFKEKAHAKGFSQDQYALVMEEYARLAPDLVNAGQALSAEQAIATLKETWKGDYETNIAGAYSVAVKLAKAAGVSEAEMDSAIGNNPVGLRMLATIAGEMKEDKSSVSANGGTDAAGGGIEALMAHPAYHDAKHPEHAAISKKVHDHFEKITPKDD